MESLVLKLINYLFNILNYIEDNCATVHNLLLTMTTEMQVVDSMQEYANKLMELPDNILEDIVKYLDIDTILQLACKHEYFSKYLPDDIYYGEYLGYNLETNDPTPVQNPNFTHQNKHIWDAMSSKSSSIMQQVVDDYLSSEDDDEDYEDQYEDKYDDAVDAFEAIQFEESFARIGW